MRVEVVHRRERHAVNRLRTALVELDIPRGKIAPEIPAAAMAIFSACSCVTGPQAGSASEWASVSE